MNKTITLPLERETKGALLYRDQNLGDKDPMYLADGLYIRKAGMSAAIGGGTAWPKAIKLTIETT